MGTWLSLLWDFVRLRWGLLTLLVLGTVPAAIAGAIFQSSVETNLRGPVVIVIGLVVGSAAIAIAESRARERRHLREIGLGEAGVFRLPQAWALGARVSPARVSSSGAPLRG